MTFFFIYFHILVTACIGKCVGALYSIEVALIKDGEITKNTVENIFSDVGKALVFYEQLVDGLATPSDLPYIMEDRILN